MSRLYFIDRNLTFSKPLTSFVERILFLSSLGMISHDALGKDEQDAYVHGHPDCVPCHAVDSEVKPVVTCPALHPHPDHPTACVPQPSCLHQARDEMRKLQITSLANKGLIEQ